MIDDDRDTSRVLIGGCVCADVTPIFFMWEKLVGTHHKPSYIRLPSRLPVGELYIYIIYHIAIMKRAQALLQNDTSPSAALLTGGILVTELMIVPAMM